MKSFTHTIGNFFQPVFHLFGWLLAFFYQIIPNYAVAITLLTVVIMGVLTPFTVKSTRSMIAMQRVQPELKKLQQKYKGAENRQLLNEEMMKLYKEEGVNPLGGCLPVLLQAPFLFMLYSVIKGLANKVMIHGHLVTLPRYIPASSKMYKSLVHSGGQINAFGMDLNLKLFSPHSSFFTQLPFAVFVLGAVGLQYFQMAQLNNRNRKIGTPMPAQQQAMQRFLPLIFAFFYMAIPAAVVLYMIVSTAIRIITQDVLFRTGVSNPHHGKERPHVEEIPAAETPVKEIKPSTPKPQAAKKSMPKGPVSKPSTIKPQPQSRSKAKRKRKER